MKHYIQPISLELNFDMETNILAMSDIEIGGGESEGFDSQHKKESEIWNNSYKDSIWK